ncbi:hypothetical protein JD844_028698, partial [Phrynosoma platyrhinos]
VSCLSSPLVGEDKDVSTKSPGLMNESIDLGDASFLEPVLRLRKGHMPNAAEQENDISDQSSEQGPLLVEPTTSSQKEKVNRDKPKSPKILKDLAISTTESAIEIAASLTNKLPLLAHSEANLSVKVVFIVKCSDKDEDDISTQEDEGFMGMLPLLQAHHAMERMEEFVCKVRGCKKIHHALVNFKQLVWEGRWRVIPFDVLPDWLKDNDYLLHGHRPPLPSFRACFKSIFRIHTETGNIWTHLLGIQVDVNAKFFFFFFLRLDYSGIALLIMGSFVPWLYYSFYCNPQPYFIYLIVICVLGIAAIIVSQWDRFATPQYRGVRAGVFLALGLSGVIPTLHFVISEGLLKAATMGQIGWLALMACLYITGAALYAARIPERFFPGKCDIWFHSHQLFHVFVVAGAFVHFHGVSNLQEFRFMVGGGCSEDEM